MDCLYKECNMTYKGVVETRNKAGRADDPAETVKTGEYLNLKFNGIIFPQPIRRICSLSKAVLRQNSCAESVSISLTSDPNSHPFNSHRQMVGQILLNRDDDEGAF